MKGRALRRALETADAYRIGGDVPLIVDTTELISPEIAYEMLLKNTHNRPINWAKVEEYAAIMRKGEWALHAQGIILDTQGNILTGQKRLWAVIYSSVSVYMRVSRGNPPTVARLLDRGTPQSARDLATRETGRKHSPTEASLGRAVLAMQGLMKPTTDELAVQIEAQSDMARALLHDCTGMRKTRAVLMILAALLHAHPSRDEAHGSAKQVDQWATELERRLQPQTAQACWGRGPAFALALEHARRVVSEPTNP